MQIPYILGLYDNLKTNRIEIVMGGDEGGNVIYEFPEGTSREEASKELSETYVPLVEKTFETAVSLIRDHAKNIVTSSLQSQKPIS